MALHPEPDATAEEIASLLDALDALPRHLDALTHTLDDAALQRRPRDDAWSVNENLAHLRACADVWGRSIRTMIEQAHPTLRYVSPRTWARKTDYHQQAFRASLAAFMTQRDELLQTLRALDQDGWSRGATFTGTTRGREQTVLSYAHRIADHEGAHRRQIEETLSAL